VFSDNIESNIEKATCEKIILFSPTDQIIPNNGNVLVGDFIKVRITDIQGYDLIGELV
jgi:hypothetical protein